MDVDVVNLSVPTRFCVLIDSVGVADVGSCWSCRVDVVVVVDLVIRVCAFAWWKRSSVCVDSVGCGC